MINKASLQPDLLFWSVFKKCFAVGFFGSSLEDSDPATHLPSSDTCMYTNLRSFRRLQRTVTDL